MGSVQAFRYMGDCYQIRASAQAAEGEEGAQVSDYVECPLCDGTGGVISWELDEQLKYLRAQVTAAEKERDGIFEATREAAAKISYQAIHDETDGRGHLGDIAADLCEIVAERIRALTLKDVVK